MAKPVLLIRAAGNGSDASALADLGIPTLVDPYLEIARSDDRSDAIELLDSLVNSEGLIWVIATSVNAIRYWAEIVGIDELKSALAARRGLHFAAIGEATAKSLIDLGASHVLTPPRADSASLATALLELPPSAALIPGGNLAMVELPHELVAAGWNVQTGVVYKTAPVATEPSSAALVRSDEIAAVLLRSPSAARAFLTYLPSPTTPIICAGPTTAKAVAEFGIKVGAVAKDPTPATVAAAIASYLKGQES